MDTTKETVVKILALAKSIGETQKLFAATRIHTTQLQADLDARKLFITPIEGWAGSNEGARKITAETAFAGDKLCTQLRDGLATEITKLATVEAELAAQEAERRGYEWAITADLVNVLHDRWNGLNPGQVLASKLATSSAREDALGDLNTPDPDVPF